MSKDLADSSLNRTLGQQSGNAKLHLTSAQNSMSSTRKSYQIFSKQLQQLVSDINILKQKVKKNPTELKKFLVDKLRPVEDTFFIAQQAQKQQNKTSQQNMTQIKRQNRQTSQSIIKTFEKLKYMEQKIGHYH